MTKLKTIALCAVFIGTVTNGLTAAAFQGVAAKRADDQPERTPYAAAAARKTPPPPFTQRADYIVEPPDLINVEVQEALPGRPISGSRLVRPDGKISVGFYGEIFVAGLTVREIKLKVVNHLQKFIRDEALGLVVLDNDGIPVVDPATGKPKRVDPKDSHQVRVELTQCNSKYYYVEGEALSPGRFPVTGTESILDAISKAGGLSPLADIENVVLYCEGSQGAPASFTVDVDQVKRGKLPSTNYQIKSGDRLVIRRRAENHHGEGSTAPKPSQPGSAATEDPSLHRLVKRMDEMERKLDAILEAIKRPAG